MEAFFRLSCNDLDGWKLPVNCGDCAKIRQRELEYSAAASIKCTVSAPGSWRDPAGESPAQVGSSVRLVVSVAGWKATTIAKRTQQSCRVSY